MMRTRGYQAIIRAAQLLESRATTFTHVERYIQQRGSGMTNISSCPARFNPNVPVVKPLSGFQILPPQKQAMSSDLGDFLVQTNKYGCGRIGFDFDGTLVKTKHWMAEALDATCETMGFKKLYPDVDDTTRQSLIKLALYKPTKDAFSEIFTEDKWQLAYEIYQKTYKEICATREPELMPGIKELFESVNEAKRLGFKLKVYVTSHSDQEILDQLIPKLPHGVSSFIDHFHGHRKTGGVCYNKPASLGRLAKGEPIPDQYNPHIYFGDGYSDYITSGSKATLVVIRAGTLIHNVLEKLGTNSNRHNLHIVKDASEFCSSFVTALNNHIVNSLHGGASR